MSNLLEKLYELLGEDIVKNLPQKEIRRLKLILKQNKWDTYIIKNDIADRFPQLNNKKTKKRKKHISDIKQTKKQKIYDVTDSSDEDYTDNNESDSYDYSDGFVVKDEDVLEIYDDKLSEIENEYNKSIINMNDVIDSKFNKNDTLWFYRNIERYLQLEGKDRYDLEDTIRRRYTLLCNLQSNKMYDSFNRDAEHDVSKEILSSNHSQVVKKILLNRMLNAVEESSEEYQKAMTWMNTILSLPTETKCINNDINITLTNLYNHLNKHLSISSNNITLSN